MRLCLCVVGRLKAGPEKTLIDDYLERFDRTGRALGLGPATIREVEARKGGGPEAEAALLRRAMPEGAALCVLDERGETMGSRAFAAALAQRRDTGTGTLVFAIGGADGLAADLREGADWRLSFGPMVWPHLLARAMLAEQLYRAASILAGTPYHRD